MFSTLTDPPCDDWREYTLPSLCENRIVDICKEIIAKGEDTRYQNIYDCIYELILPSVEEDYFNKSF